MKRTISATLAGGLVGAATLVAVTATPASAGVGASSSGTQILVIATGAVSVSFSCVGGNAAVNGTAVSPTLACSAVTKATVAGDGSAQTVDGRGLDAAAFSADPWLYASLGDGNDVLHDTAQADQIAMGAGYDTVILNPSSVPDTSIDMGTGGGGTEVDTVETGALDSGNTITAATSGSNLVITYTNAAGTHVRTIANAEFAWLTGGKGNDILTSTGISTSSPVVQLRMDGGAGNDRLTTGALGGLLWGNAGANTFTTGSGFATIVTDSDTDTLHLGSGGSNIIDSTSLRSGGRTITGTTGADGYGAVLPHGDAVTRIRPNGGGVLITNSLDRFGQQQLPATTTSAGVSLSPSSGTNPVDKGIADVVAKAGTSFDVAGEPDGVAPTNIADITIPSGTWSTSGSTGTTKTLTITPTGYGVIRAKNMADVDIHGPWPSADQSFAHRVVRDLMFRFPTDSQRALITAQLDAHTKTRADIIAYLMASDEYRSLDVNRTFLDFLDRPADPGGLAYWVNSLGNGKPLVQFRAQLFGSNEYFTKAGGTNLGFLLAAYADVFGRTPDASGQAFWLNRLNNGTDRGVVARTFLASTEARRTIVKEQFLRFVNRFPTTAEADQWVASLAGPTGEQDLIAFLAGSGAYFAGP